MIIQLPNILTRDGMLTASGIHVVPDPILAILTPAGPVIMSSVAPPSIACIVVTGWIPLTPAEISFFSAGIPGMPAMPPVVACAESSLGGALVMFICAESLPPPGTRRISIAPIFPCTESAPFTRGRASIRIPAIGADFCLGGDFVGTAPVGARSFAVKCLLPTILVLTIVLPAVGELDLALVMGLFFFVGASIRMFIGIFDFEESRVACCGS
jgi:hypothetical protein